ncbi:MAG: Crp/Fnr family transcriptional regulator [Candidatus Competibacteraceae bacterium]|nr:Crp/Fnr family transcriptional regulator [Candidatus Competibacteraceae bacterium]
MLSSSGSSTHNRLLAALPPDAYTQLQTQWELIALVVAEYLQVPGEPLSYVYFPTGVVFILVCQVDQRPPLTVSLVGVPVFLGTYSTRWGARGHLAGRALRLPAEVFRQSCQNEGPLPNLLRGYTALRLAQVIRNVACGRFHLLSARLARWLFKTDDSSPASEMRLTHQALAELLGVRCEAVSHTSGMLQRQQLIGYRRGALRILDHAGLELEACSCYRPMGTGDQSGQT